MLKKYASFIDQTLVSGGNFLTVAICAHFLPLEEQGKFIYVFSSYIGLVLLNVSGIFQGAAVLAPSKDQTYEPALARFQVYSALLMALFVGLIWRLVGPSLGWDISAYDAGLIITFLFFQQLTDFTRRSSYIFSTDQSALLSSLLTYPARLLALYLIVPSSVDVVLIILIASSCIPTGVAIRKANQSKLILSKWTELVLEHLNYSKLFIAGSVLSWLWAYAPVFILGMLQGKAAAALLASIRGISSMANIFIEQLETKAVADWSRQFHREGTKSVQSSIDRLNKIAFVFWALVMGIIYSFHESIVAIILGDQYLPYASVLMIAWIGYGAFYVARIYGIQHRTFGDNRIEFIAGIFGLLSAAIGSYLLIPLFQVEGAAWVYALIAITMLCIQVVVPKKSVEHYG
jgi:O-antigen/teichoic acid export membrane protein